MENLVVNSLVVSGLGMLLLFFVLTLLYALMYLMTAVLKDPASTPGHPAQEEQRAPGGEEAKYRAAVIAIALARAGQELRSVGTPLTGEIVGTESISPWWTFHHDRQLRRKPLTRRTR